MPLTPRLPLLAATLALLTLILAAVSLNATLTPTAQAQTTTTDYDSNDDGLIEVSNLAQLNAIRWDLDGDGSVAATDQANYTAAFPNTAASMGCPDGSHGDGSVTTADSGGFYWNGGAGWTPIAGGASPTPGSFGSGAMPFPTGSSATAPPMQQSVCSDPSDSAVE